MLCLIHAADFRTHLMHFRFRVARFRTRIQDTHFRTHIPGHAFGDNESVETHFRTCISGRARCLVRCTQDAHCNNLACFGMNLNHPHFRSRISGRTRCLARCTFQDAHCNLACLGLLNAISHCQACHRRSAASVPLSAVLPASEGEGVGAIVCDMHAREGEQGEDV